MRTLRAHCRVHKSLGAQSHVLKSVRAQGHIRQSERLGYVSHFLEVDGELVHVKERCDKRSLYAINKKDVMYHHNDYDDDVDVDVDDEADNEDTNSSDNDCVYKKGCDEEDWVPKSQRKSRTDFFDGVDNVDHDKYISSCHAYHHNILTRDYDVKGRFDGYLDDNDDGHEAMHACIYDNDDVNYSTNTENAGPSNIVTYFRRTRKLLQCIPKRFDKQRRRSCRGLSSVRKKVNDLPSWFKKKRRAFRKKNDKWATSIKADIDSWNAPVYSRSELAKSSALSQACEGSLSLGTTLLPPQPSPPPVFLTTVLEGLPKELVESEAPESIHEGQSAHISSLRTTSSTERYSPYKLEKLDADKEKTEGPEELTRKLKRKKHRPKVIRDIFDKVKRMPKSRKQEKDGVLKDKQTKLPRKPCAKKKQGSRESTTKIKKSCGLKQEFTSVANNGIISKDDNLSTISSCTPGEANSIMPFQSNDLIVIPDQPKDTFTLQNIAVKEVSYAQGLLVPSFYPRKELFKDPSMSTCLADGQVRLSPELTSYMHGYKVDFQCQQEKQLAPCIYANRWPSSLGVTKEAAWSSGVFSLVQSKSKGSTELLLTQEPNNQLELVPYDQRREIITSKSTSFPNKVRAKVHLNIENERIWPLLALGGIPKEFEDVRYWERERALMERRVEIFICTMKTVQGDRQFSPWKGSILDSLVGAFLTQNVSDHLSSSAFMSIASRFPSKQGNDSDRTHTPSADTICESEVSSGVPSDTGDENEESSDTQGDHDIDMSNQEGMLLTCRMPVKCMHISNLSTSLRAIKRELRNNYTEDVKFRRTSATSFKSLGEEDGYLKDDFHLDSSKSLGSALKDAIPLKNIGEEESAFLKDDIHLNQSSSPSRSLAEEDSSLKDEKHSNPSSPSLLEENLPTKQHDVRIPSLCDKEITISSTMQCGMEQRPGLAPCLLEAPSSISVSRPNLQDTNTVWQNGMQHSEKPLSCSAQEQNLMQLSIPSVIHSTRVSMQHLERVSICSIADENSTIHSNVSTFGSSYHESRIDRPNVNESSAICNSEGTLCSMFRSEVSCNHESLTSPSITRKFLACSDLSNALQKVRTPVKETYSVEQFLPEKSPERRTEVYNNHAVCKSLFKDDMFGKAKTSLDSNNNQQKLSTLDTDFQSDVHLYAFQTSKEVHYESDVGHNAAIPSVSKIVGKRRRNCLSGIERAHLEENQYGRKRNHTQDWEALRKLTLQSCSSCENTSEEIRKEDAYQDSVDWDAVRCTSVEELAATIKERGMHHVLSGRIKAFLKTLHEEQGNLDLEWLKKVSPKDAKAYLTAIRGLGVKSVECIRLLTLHHVAFPVDVNVGRICVRLGWVPIEPLPEQLQLHLLELYPVQETIQKYLWPRLCTLDQKTLYELHYQLITFGKVFCTKSKPNCNACPMRTECKHFASAYASAKLLLTDSHDKPLKRLGASSQVHALTNSSIHSEEESMVEDVSDVDKATSYPQILDVVCEPADTDSAFDHQYYIEEPASPETTHESDIGDIEDFPCIYGCMNDFTEDLLKAFSETPPKSLDGTCKGDGEKCDTQCCLQDESTFHQNTDGQFNSKEGFTESCFGYQSDNPSDEKALSCESKVCQDTFVVSEAEANAIAPLLEGSYIPAPKLKSVDRLRTIHYVYELPDNHPLLKQQADVREKDDPSLYLLAIWSPGEAPDSLQGLDAAMPVANPNEIVSGTLLIPCRTAMRGKFPLNGTYFQLNEVFADHASSLRPLQVPRSHIWSLQRRFVYFGTSISSILRGLTSDEIKCCFLRGHVCVRGFDREKRAPRPLVCRLHFPISKQIRRHKEPDQESFST